MSERSENSSLTGSDYEPAWLSNLLNAGSAIAMDEVTRALRGEDDVRRQSVAEVRGNAESKGLFGLDGITLAVIAAAVVIPGGFLLWLAFRKK